MAKLKGGRLAREVTDSCLQFWGGMGYTSDVGISRYVTRSHLSQIDFDSSSNNMSIASLSRFCELAYLLLRAYGKKEGMQLVQTNCCYKEN